MRKLLITSVFVVVGIPYSLLAAEPNPYDVNKPSAQPSTAGQQPPAAEPQTPAPGQQPPAVTQQPPTVESLLARIVELEKQLQNLKIEKAALSEQVDKLVSQLLIQKEEWNTRVGELSKRLEQVATKDGDNWVPNVRAAMEKSQTFQKDLFEVTTATVEINNQTGEPVEVFVNGVKWRLTLGTNTLNVPYGPVRLEFVTAQGDRDPWIYREQDWKRENHQARLTLQITSGQTRPF